MSAPDLNVRRHEEKYLLSQPQAAALRALLDAVLRRDKFSTAGAYYIRSLYFDTPDDRDFTEKLLGVAERTKLRLRIYDTAAKTAKLEIKAKSGSTSHKRSATLMRADARALIAGDDAPLLHSASDTARAAWTLYRGEARRSAVLVDYERTAWVAPVGDGRITLDEQIRAAKQDTLFEAGVPMAGLHSGGAVVLEIKYNHPLPPYLRNLLSSVPGQPMSISKYATARSILY